MKKMIIEERVKREEMQEGNKGRKKERIEKRTEVRRKENVRKK